ncbi:MAG: NMD3-related protein [Candidatus Diapherotrites archaeon]|nr:NMD3-related protein [Candidatus Diapherotrites archaeon]
MQPFCPKCGTTEGPFIGLFCRTCFLLDHPDVVKVPPILELERCKRCEKVRVHGNWIPWEEKPISKWVASHIKSRELSKMDIAIEYGERQEKHIPLLIQVSGSLLDHPVDFQFPVNLKLKGSICNDDMLVSSDYYEGILQVRFTEPSIDKIRQTQTVIESALVPLHATDSKAVVVNWITQKFGFDAWIVSKKAAKAAAVSLARRHNVEMTVTSKLIGLSRTGKERHRKTFLVRLE